MYCVKEIVWTFLFRMTFEINCWLSAFLNQGLITIRETPPDEIHALLGWKHLLLRNFIYQFYNRHLWLSLFVREPRSGFWRNQRLACCFITVELLLLTNAVVLYTIPGPHHAFSNNTLIQGICLALVVSIIMEAFGVVFRRTRHDKQTLAQMCISFKPFKPLIPMKTLPYWSSYFVYTAILVTTSITASYCTRCAFIWGKDEGFTFIAAVVLSFVLSLFCLPFLKVRLISWSSISKDTSVQQ